MADAAEDHREAQPVGSRDYIRVTNRSTWLDHGSCTSPCRFFDAVREREKCV
jgi:hypothetical protein